MKDRKKLIILVIASLVLIVAALPALSACGPEAQPGQVLKVGIITPTTGAAAEKGSPMGDANLDAIKYINDELGGVEGYKIEPLWFDSNYDAAKVATIVNNLMNQGALLFTTSSSKEMQAALEIANRAEFPGLVCFNAPSLHRPPQHIYGQTPDYGDDWTAFATYYMDNIWKGSGKPKMALMVLNNPTGYGARDAARAAADGLGIDVLWDGQVGKAFEHTATTTSETETLTRVKALDPDVIYISSTPAPTALIIKNASELGLYPGVTIGCGHASFTKALIDIAGAAVTEGVYGVFPTANWGDDVPGMAKVVEYAGKLHAKDVNNLDYVTAWAQSLVVAEILRNAVKNVGYDALAKGDVSSWRAIEIQGIQKLKDYNVGGLQGPVSYDTGDNRLSKALRIFQVKSGKITPVTDWIEAPLVKYESFDWFGK
jgi:branched-chain amino acid transport system substrate-binding protein